MLSIAMLEVFEVYGLGWLGICWQGSVSPSPTLFCLMLSREVRSRNWPRGATISMLFGIWLSHREILLTLHARRVAREGRQGGGIAILRLAELWAERPWGVVESRRDVTQ